MNERTSNVRLSHVVCGSVESACGCTSQSPSTLTIWLSHAIAMEGPLEQALSTPRAPTSSTPLPLVSLTIPLVVLIISNIRFLHGELPWSSLYPLSVYPAALMSSSVGPEPLHNDDDVATAPTRRRHGHTDPARR